MAIHWFAIVCFVLAGLGLAGALICVGAKDELGWLFVLIAAAMFWVGTLSAVHANKQNEGLGARNKKEFTNLGYKVISAYSHRVCVAAGPYKECLQEHKDATGKKQLVMPTGGGSWVVVGHSFVNAVAKAPNLTYPPKPEPSGNG